MRNIQHHVKTYLDINALSSVEIGESLLQLRDEYGGCFTIRRENLVNFLDAIIKAEKHQRRVEQQLKKVE